MKRCATLLAALLGAAAAQAQESREISFPDTEEGLHVLSVDTHVHTAFSDGGAWPDVRVLEAIRDGLDALAITDHIDTQAHREDIPHPDRNRSFDLARQAAERIGTPMIVIKGVEIAHPSTECIECSHVNALFVTDNNVLRHRGWNDRLGWKTEAPLPDAFASVQAAREFGAFIIWNHPGEESPVKMSKFNRQLFEAELVDGIEVVNGPRYWEGAFQFALDNDLAIVGASDIHDTMDNMLKGEALYQALGEPMEQRPATLVLATDKSEAAIADAFEARRTAALYRHTLIGREREVRPIVEAALSLEIIGPEVNGPKVRAPGDPVKVLIRNKASSPFALRRKGTDQILTAGPIIEVPASGETSIWLLPGTDTSALSLEFEVLNALIGPRRTLHVTLKV